jgi:hypothetical protein
MVELTKIGPAQKPILMRPFAPCFADSAAGPRVYLLNSDDARCMVLSRVRACRDYELRNARNLSIRSIADNLLT